MMRGARLILLLTTVAGCVSNSPAAPGGPVNAQVVLAPGQIAQIESTSLRLRFQGVMGDSRCPADAFCIQAGDAVVRIDVIPSRRPSTTYDLHTGSTRAIRHEDVTIALVELSPYPFISRPIVPNDYRATLRVTR